jgi:hypothetical protein
MVRYEQLKSGKQSIQAAQHIPLGNMESLPSPRANVDFRAVGGGREAGIQGLSSMGSHDSLCVLEESHKFLSGCILLACEK